MIVLQVFSLMTSYHDYDSLNFHKEKMRACGIDASHKGKNGAA